MIKVGTMGSANMYDAEEGIWTGWPRILEDDDLQASSHCTGKDSPGAASSWLESGSSNGPECFFDEFKEHPEMEEEVIAEFEDLVRGADFSAEKARETEFRERKRKRSEKLLQYVESKDNTEELTREEISKVSRLLCNQDSAAARRKRDNVYREQLCVTLEDLEDRMRSLEQIIRNDAEANSVEYLRVFDHKELRQGALTA